VNTEKNINLSEWHWYSDWNGDEVNFPNIDVVGLYYNIKEHLLAYINTETLEILEYITESPF
jgi:hypothetical protein